MQCSTICAVHYIRLWTFDIGHDLVGRLSHCGCTYLSVTLDLFVTSPHLPTSIASMYDLLKKYASRCDDRLQYCDNPLGKQSSQTTNLARG